jgi:hypothetical protein
MGEIAGIKTPQPAVGDKSKTLAGWHGVFSAFFLRGQPGALPTGLGAGFPVFLYPRPDRQPSNGFF